MKIFTLLFFASVFIIISPAAFGQKDEININAFAGLFFFSGEGSTHNSTLNIFSYGTPPIATSNLYGRNGKLSYSFEAEVKQFVYPNFYQGAGIGFDILASKVHIDSINEFNNGSNVYPADGSASLHFNNFNLFYFIGYRVMINKSSLDLSLGLGVAKTFNIHEKVDQYNVDNLLDRSIWDIQPRIQIKLNKNKIGYLLSYTHGLRNYQIPFKGKAYSNFLKAGLSFKIK